MMRFLLGYGSCGIASGAQAVGEAIEKALSGSAYALERVGCNGMCFAEPLLTVINGEKAQPVYYGRLDEKSAREIVAALLQGDTPAQNRLTDDEMRFFTLQERHVLRLCGLIDPESLASYRTVGGYSALKKAQGMLPEEIIRQMELSGLRGRGGGGFPTAVKWEAARREAGDEKYIVCNADEGDPGAFMDRSVLEGNPHSVLEGMMIAGLAVGAREGLIYVRAEYPLAVKRLRIAIEQLRGAGLLGKGAQGKRPGFDIRLTMGAGAFVCGEETALIASQEGNRGMPRPKPPFPAQAGFRGKPTVINNVETLANVADIIAQGGEAFAALGAGQSRGTKVFALAGKIKRGGLVEVPMGVTLRHVIYDIGGGIRADRPFKAVQIGGPSGGCLPESLLDTPIDYAAIGKTGAIMGSGGLVVMDDTACMVDMARFFMRFTSNESCGKCAPCRVGTTRMRQMLDDICEGRGKQGDIERLQALGEAIRDSALCGLGASAPNPALTTIRYFREEYEEHIRDKRCRALKCEKFVRYAIDPQKCVGCSLCSKKCPAGAITGAIIAPYVIDGVKCVACGVCAGVCKFGAPYKTSGEAEA